jgi:PQQ-dependent dehydrogenase (methanol/ethanol family)
LEASVARLHKISVGLYSTCVVFLLASAGACARHDEQSPRESAAATPARSASARSGDWMTYNGPPSGDRYSPLAQITAANVGQIRQVCAFDAPEAVNFQSGILAVNGVLYFTLFNHTYAVDGATCQQKWKHTRPEPDTFLMVNRGVAYDDGRLFRGTGDAHVLGIDAVDGRQLWDIAIGDPKKGESVPMAPIAWNGLVFVGIAGGDNFGVSGRTYALDAASGRIAWQFNSVPDSGPARATWQQASPEHPPGGGAAWTSYALDEQNAVLYVPAGNASPDFVQALRPGDNLYTNSLLALDAKTGRLLAYAQPIKGDFHDWDLSAAPALITTRSGRPFVAAGAKDGYVYNIDRSAVATATSGEPDAARLVIRSKTLVTTRENADAALSPDRETRFCPGVQGGVEWNGPAYHPRLGLLYVNAIDWCTSVKLQPVTRMKGAPGTPWTGAEPADGWLFGKHDPVDRWKGWVTAFDAESGEIKWKIQTPKPMVAAITATAGGLVITGDLDGHLLAYDASTGKELWRHATGKAIGGGVISYAVGGTQHIAAATGINAATWSTKAGPARVVVYALP